MAAGAVIVPMPDTSELIKSFRVARTMSAFAQGNLFQFNLDGTSVLIPTLVTCVKTINSGGLAAAMDFTAPNLAAKTANPRRRRQYIDFSQYPAEGSAEYQLVAMQIASISY
jgi:hypothetical protein